MSDNFDSLHSEGVGAARDASGKKKAGDAENAKRSRPQPVVSAAANSPSRPGRLRGSDLAHTSRTRSLQPCVRRRKQAPRNKSPAANKRLRQARCSLARQAGDLRIKMDGDLVARPVIWPRITPASCRRFQREQLRSPQGMRKLKLIARLANGFKEIWFFPKVAQQLIGPCTQRRDLCMAERTEPSHRFVDRSLSRSPCLITFVKRNGGHSELQGHLFYPWVCEKDVGLLAISKQRAVRQTVRGVERRHEP